MPQLALHFAFSLFTLHVIAKLLPGFEVEHLPNLIIASFIIGAINFLILSILAILRLPISYLSLFTTSFIMNALMLNVSTGLIDEYDVNSWSAALLGALMLSLVQLLSNSLEEDRKKLIS